MATRIGKLNFVSAKTGPCSARNRLFICAGSASVWDWGDTPANEEPIGTAFTCDTDCRVVVGAAMRLLLDVSIVNMHPYVQSCDIGIIISKQVLSFCDCRQQITGAPNMEKYFDAIISIESPVSIRSDEGIVVSSQRIVISDVSVATSCRFTLESDHTFHITHYELFECCTDAQIIITHGTIFQIDFWACIRCHKQLATDVQMIATNTTSLSSDSRLQILVRRDVETAADIRLMIAEYSSTVKEVALSIDLSASIYSYLCRESHIIKAS